MDAPGHSARSVTSPAKGDIHLIRYHGVLAPNAKDRSLIVPGPAATDGTKEQITGNKALSSSQRPTWAAILARVFLVDPLISPRCGGRMKPVAALTDADSICQYLTGVGLPVDPPPIAPARPPPATCAVRPSCMYASPWHAMWSSVTWCARSSAPHVS
jgi:hypothetical protein